MKTFDLRMLGVYIRIVNAQQAKISNIYKNTKLKLLKINAAIWFNKVCRIKQHNRNLHCYSPYAANIDCTHIEVKSHVNSFNQARKELPEDGPNEDRNMSECII
jgi:hypothetical protein